MKTITLSGGFHNSGEIRFRLTDEKYNDLKSQRSTLYEVLSPNQLKRATNHFCGISGCCCGSYARAEIDFD